MKSLASANAAPADVALSPVLELEGGLRLLARLIAQRILASRELAAQEAQRGRMLPVPCGQAA